MTSSSPMSSIVEHGAKASGRFSRGRLRPKGPVQLRVTWLPAEAPPSFIEKDACLQDSRRLRTHSPQYVWFRAGMGGARHRALILELVDEQSRVHGIAGAVLSRGRLRGLLGTTTLKLESHPCVQHSDLGLLQHFLVQLEQKARDLGAGVLEIGSFESGHSPVGLLESLGFATHERLEYVLDLRCSQDALWRGLSGAKRRNLRKAQRLGVTLREGRSLEDLETLQHCQGHSCRRRGRSARVSPRRRQIMRMAMLETGLARLFLVESKGEVLSAALIYTYQKQGFYSQGGSTPEGMQNSASAFVLWQAAMKLRDEGFESFNFGGTPADAVDRQADQHGLYRFKRDFGTKVERCTSGCKVIRRTQAVSRQRSAISQKSVDADSS